MKGRWSFPSNIVFVLFPRLQNEGWLNRKLSGAESGITHPRRWLTHQCVVHTWYGGGTSPETLTEGPRESCLWSQAPHQPTGEQIQPLSSHIILSHLDSSRRGEPATDCLERRTREWAVSFHPFSELLLCSSSESEWDVEGLKTCYSCCGKVREFMARWQGTFEAGGSISEMISFLLKFYFMIAFYEDLKTN